MRTRTFSCFTAILLVSIFVTPRAIAGTKFPYPVNVAISGNATIAWGSVSDARSSADNAYLFCGIGANKGQQAYGYCDAYDPSTSRYAYCTTSDAAEVQVIASMKGDSYIQFTYYSPGNDCSFIFSGTGSTLAPKLP